MQTVVLPGTGGGTITYYYDRAGNRIRTTRPNGVTTLYGYDVNNRLTGVNNSVGGSFVYFLDGAGRRLSISDAGNNLLETYTYDAAGRLTGESGAAGTIGYTYDGAGNRLTRTSGGQTSTYHYDADDRLKSISGGLNLTYGYDANGNLTTVNNTPTNTYDFENHLVSSGASSYSYDGQGNRIAQSASGTLTNYLVDTNTSYAQVIEEQTSGSTARYDFGLDRERVSRSSGVYYYIYDGLGSTRALTSTSGGLANSYAYDAYGNPTAAPSGTSYLFNGQQLDSTGLYFLRARYYDPQSGRFLSQDPLDNASADPAGANRYAYGNGDPVNQSDPTGMSTEGLNGQLTAIGNIGMLAARYSVALHAGFSFVYGLIDPDGAQALANTEGSIGFQLGAAADEFGANSGGLLRKAVRGASGRIREYLELSAGTLEEQFVSLENETLLSVKTALNEYARQVRMTVSNLSEPTLSRMAQRFGQGDGNVGMAYLRTAGQRLSYVVLSGGEEVGSEAVLNGTPGAGYNGAHVERKIADWVRSAYPDASKAVGSLVVYTERIPCDKNGVRNCSAELTQLQSMYKDLKLIIVDGGFSSGDRITPGR